MNRLSRILRATLRYVGYGLALLLVLIVAGLGFVGFTDTGARVAVSYAERIAAASGQVISISEPSGLLTGRLRAGTVTLGDADGTYAEIRDLAVDWSPLQLLFFSFDASRVSASSVSLLRLPVSKADAEPAESKPFSLPVEVPGTRDSLRAGVFFGRAYPQVIVRAGWAHVSQESLPPTPRLPLDAVFEVE